MLQSNRQKLKDLFHNKSQLSATHFAELIDAALVRQDDKFHGLWRAGQVYRTGDVVVYQRQLWEMVGETEICAKSNEMPSEKQPNSWKSFTDDDDWAVLADEGVMWAKIFDKVGIGVGFDENDLPKARLDIRKETGRWLLFPEAASRTQQTFLHYAFDAEQTAEQTAEQAPPQTSALITDLSLSAATWWSNATEGFAFRHRHTQLDEPAALQSTAMEGEMMLSIHPQQAHPDTAGLGLNVAAPTALIEAVDPRKGHFVLLPDVKPDPTLALLNLASDGNAAYFSAAVNHQQTAWTTNAETGFVFTLSDAPFNDAAIPTTAASPSLLRIRQHSQGIQPQVGIGVDCPEACLDVRDRNFTHIQLLPTANLGPSADLLTLPTISVVQQPPEETRRYLHHGLGEQVAGWVTNAPDGFVVRQQREQKREIRDSSLQTIDQGRTHLSIREDGRVGIGTETPNATLEITTEAQAGRLLFSPSPYGTSADSPALTLLNHAAAALKDTPEEQNDIYFTLGTQAIQSVFITNAVEGFTFKAGANPQAVGAGWNMPSADRPDADLLDTNGGQLLVNISPEGNGRVGIGKRPDDYSLDVQGLTQGLTFYQAHHADWMKAVTPLGQTLEKVQQLQPITFEWNGASGVADAGAQIGLRAEDVHSIFPQVVKTNGDGRQSLAYQNLVPVLIKALNELTEKNQKEHDFFEKYVRYLNDRTTVLAIGVLVSWIMIAIFEYWGG